MGIWVNKETKVIVQGITGTTARYHTMQMLEYGTKIVAGVSPNKKITTVEGVPVFSSMKNAVKETGATVQKWK